MQLNLFVFSSETTERKQEAVKTLKRS